MKTFQNRKRRTFPIIWCLLRNLGYLFIIFILAFILLNGTDQSIDFIIAFIDRSEPWYYISLAILLFFWSYITWYSASVILQARKRKLNIILNRNTMNRNSINFKKIQ